MNDLLQAMQIFAKYIPNEKYPTWCEHDVLHVCCDGTKVTEQDKSMLDILGFHYNEEDNDFYSFKFGSC